MSMKSSPAPEKTEMQICLLAVNHPLQHDEIESLANAGVRSTYTYSASREDRGAGHTRS